MGKSTVNRAMKQAIDIDISPENSTPMSEPAFSSGELGQLQEILYGAQQRTTNEQLITLQTQINEQIQTMGNMLNSRINQISDSMDMAAKVHEKNINELKAEQSAASKLLSNDIDQRGQKLESSIAELGENSGKTTDIIRGELKNVESQLQTQLSETQDALSSKIEASAKQLQSNKLDKQNFAQILGDMSKQIDLDKH